MYYLNTQDGINPVNVINDDNYDILILGGDSFTIPNYIEKYGNRLNSDRAILLKVFKDIFLNTFIINTNFADRCIKFKDILNGVKSFYLEYPNFWNKYKDYLYRYNIDEKVFWELEYHKDIGVSYQQFNDKYINSGTYSTYKTDFKVSLLSDTVRWAYFLERDLKPFINNNEKVYFKDINNKPFLFFNKEAGIQFKKTYDLFKRGYDLDKKPNDNILFKCIDNENVNNETYNKKIENFAFSIKFKQNDNEEIIAIYLNIKYIDIIGKSMQYTFLRDDIFKDGL